MMMFPSIYIGKNKLPVLGTLGTTVGHKASGDEMGRYKQTLYNIAALRYWPQHNVITLKSLCYFITSISHANSKLYAAVEMPRALVGSIRHILSRRQ